MNDCDLDELHHQVLKRLFEDEGEFYAERRLKGDTRQYFAYILGSYTFTEINESFETLNKNLVTITKIVTPDKKTEWHTMLQGNIVNVTLTKKHKDEFNRIHPITLKKQECADLLKLLTSVDKPTTIEAAPSTQSWWQRISEKMANG